MYEINYIFFTYLGASARFHAARGYAKGQEALKNGQNRASSDQIGQNGPNAAQLVAMVSRFEKTAGDKIAENVSYDLVQNGPVWVENDSLCDL